MAGGVVGPFLDFERPVVSNAEEMGRCVAVLDSKQKKFRGAGEQENRRIFLGRLGLHAWGSRYSGRRIRLPGAEDRVHPALF